MTIYSFGRLGDGNSLLWRGGGLHDFAAFHWLQGSLLQSQCCCLGDSAADVRGYRSLACLKSCKTRWAHLVGIRTAPRARREWHGSAVSGHYVASSSISCIRRGVLDYSFINTTQATRHPLADTLPFWHHNTCQQELIEQGHSKKK